MANRGWRTKAATGVKKESQRSRSRSANGVVRPSRLVPGYPAPLEAIVMKAMAKSPSDRYATAEEFRADLLRFVDGRPVEASDVAATTTMGAIGATEAVMVTGSTQAVPVGAVGAGGSVG